MAFRDGEGCQEEICWIVYRHDGNLARLKLRACARSTTSGALLGRRLGRDHEVLASMAPEWGILMFIGS